jgi:predicted kinase
MMVGIPGSGKTSYANSLVEKNLADVRYSSDDIRAELSDTNEEFDNECVFQILGERVIRSLKDGKSTVLDATNLNRRKRMAFLKKIENIACMKFCILMAVPYKVCVENDKERENSVGEQVINKMIRSFQTPTTLEGFEHIKIIFPDYISPYDTNNFWEDLAKFQQDNKYHTLVLGLHLALTANRIPSLTKDRFDNDQIEYYVGITEMAALLHDCMKPICKSFTNWKGEKTESATYYGHENASGYEMICIIHDQNPLICTEDLLLTSIIINFHMRPLTAWKNSPKAKKKDTEFLGEDLIKCIELLHEADQAAR